MTAISSTFQNAAALVVVAAAAAYIARQAWAVIARKRSAGCGGGCPKCVTESGTTEPNVIALDLGQPARKPVG